jgi:hypothetical protein
LRYRPYIARYDGEEIIVVPRDRELSDAQESGLDPGWFQHELYERTKYCDFPALVTTWTDGENGGWLRTTHVESGFWGHFYHTILDRYQQGTLGFTPVHISEYLERYPPTEEVEMHRGGLEYRAPLGWRFYSVDRIASPEKKVGTRSGMPVLIIKG